MIRVSCGRCGGYIASAETEREASAIYRDHIKACEWTQ